MEFGSDVDAARSRTTIVAAGSDALIATATAETRGCRVGDAATYRWSLEGKDTVMTLTADGVDACVARERGLAGSWVRSDLPVAPDGVPMQPGIHATAAFSPFEGPEATGQLTYIVGDRWKVKEDRAGIFLLHHLGGGVASDPSGDLFIHLFTQPRAAADYVNGATCGPTTALAGAGITVDDLVAVIRARPGVVSTSPSRVVIGGYEGQLLDVHVAPSWTGGCRTPDGRVVALPLLVGSEFEMGAAVGIGPDGPVRLVVLDLTGGRTMAIAVFAGGPVEPSQLNAEAGEAMRVIESFQFHPPIP
jgi:hypothetical protein